MDGEKTSDTPPKLKIIPPGAEGRAIRFSQPFNLKAARKQVAEDRARRIAKGHIVAGVPITVANLEWLVTCRIDPEEWLGSCRRMGKGNVLVKGHSITKEALEWLESRRIKKLQDGQ